MEIKSLEKIGLTRNESLVYLSLLKLGTSKTGEILKDSKLNSGKIYEILDRLKERGLISESIINNVRHFTAAPPSEILNYLEQKKKSITEEEETIKKVIPKLELLRNQNILEPKAVVYTGFRGFKTAVNEATKCLKEKDEILSMGITGLKDERFSRFWRLWSKKTLSKRKTARYIFSEKSEHYEMTKKLNLVECKILTGITPVTVDIFGDQITLILQYEKPSSFILIYDKNTTKSFRTFFEQLWKAAN